MQRGPAPILREMEAKGRHQYLHPLITEFQELKSPLALRMAFCIKAGPAALTCRVRVQSLWVEAVGAHIHRPQGSRKQRYEQEDH